MKIIITEEQYNELSDWDIYSQLSPWSRRRIKIIDIKSSLERHIKRNTKMILDNPIEATEGLIYKIIWDTVPLVWNVNMEEDEFDKYFHELYPLINKKYGEYIQSEVDRIYDEEWD